MKFDLHTHSYYSDGTAAPAEVVRRAKIAGVTLLSLTDHDSVAGIDEAAKACKEAGIEFLPGIEINTAEKDQIHVLGYGIDHKSPALLAKLEEHRRLRRDRVERMIKKLQEMKIEISMSDLEAVSKDALGRPHIADALKKKGYVRTRQEAFKRYLALGAPAYVDPIGPDIKDAITIIKEAGGVSSLAHPGFVKRGLEYPKWVEWGLGGVEAYYPTHTGNYIRRLSEDAKPYGILLTGGSDFHGPGTERDKLGVVEPPPEVYETFIEKLRPRLLI